MRLTESIRKQDVERQWLLVDATDIPLGRLSSEIAKRLRGKHRADYTPHVDSGDNIVIINAQRVRLTGRKLLTHTHFWHTGFPGGIKSINAWDELTGKHPQRIVERAIERMLPKSKLGRGMIGKVHVYPGKNHPHTAQQPKAWDLGSELAKKNWS